jgi:DNA-binding NarL/FixJ family response regulator
MKLRVLVADDHPLYREALRRVVGDVRADAEFAEAADYAELLARTTEDERFDLILVDLMMPGGDEFNGLVTLRKRAPLTPVIVVSSRTDRASIERAISCGVAGYIPKSASKTVMARAIRSVLAGDVSLPENGERIRPAGSEQLTPRQYAVLEQLARGNSNRQIATDLGIEEITVKAHISAILRKLKVKNRLQAVVASRAFLDQPRA